MAKPEPPGGSGDKPTPVEKQAPSNQWLSLLNLGWIFMATLGLCVFGGLWMDKRFGTAPLFILIGVFFGFAASGYTFYQALRKLNGEASGKHQE